jgi:NADPH-dependent curcumin reductase CurA
MVQNKSLVLARHPVGLPIPGEDLIITSSEFDLNGPPPEGGLVLKTHYLSFDPFQRDLMRPASGYALNEPLSNNAISTVISSSNPRFKAGDIVIATVRFSEYQTIEQARADEEQLAGGGGGVSLLRSSSGLDPVSFLGALGMSGLTAYSSLYEVGKPKKGEVMFISAASGAVGQIVGQLAKREGLTVIGSVGSEAKLKFIQEELGFDGGFNYKSEKAEDALKRLLAEIGKDGLDIYYDNVGGEQLDAAIGAMNTFGRIRKSSHPIGHLKINGFQWLVVAFLKQAKSWEKPTVSEICRGSSAKDLRLGGFLSSMKIWALSIRKSIRRICRSGLRMKRSRSR